MTALIGFPNEFRLWLGGQSPSVTNFTLNQTTDQWEVVFQAPEAITITRLGFRQGSVTGTSPVFKLSLQGVDGSGNPDGTIKGGGSPASMTFTPVAGGNNAWVWKTLDNSYACARGEMLSSVIAYDSGTVDGSNNCSFTITGSAGSSGGVPYATQNDAGARTKQAASPLFGFGSSGTAYGQPFTTAIASAFSSASTPDEKALLLNLPTTFCSSYKIIGAIVYGTLAAAGAFDLKLYDTNGTTVLQATSFDTDQDASPTSARIRQFFFDDTPSTLNAGSTYRISFLPTTGSLALAGFTTGANADMDAWPYGAAFGTGSTRTDAGAWTDDPKTRYGINPILSDITLSAASGGGAPIVGSPIVRGVGRFG